MVTEQQYLDALAIVREYVFQLEETIKQSNSIVESVPFLQQKAMLLSLKKGDRIEILKKTRHLPSVNTGDVFDVIDVIVEPYLRADAGKRRIDDTFVVHTTVRRGNGKRHRFTTRLYHYTYKQGESEAEEMDITFEVVEFKKIAA